MSDSVALFVEARYTYLELDADWRSTTTVSVGGAPVGFESESDSDDVDLSGLGATVGLLWEW